MNQQKWERDIINRQRNIVFPDTILNEGRFYRNIASGKAIFTLGQKISLRLTLAFFITVNAVDFAKSFSRLIAQNHFRKLDLWPSLDSLIWLLFWIILAVKALFPVERKRIVRGGYRTKRSKKRWYGNHRSGGRISTAGLRRKA